MNKNELIAQIAEKIGSSQNNAAIFLGGFVETVKKAVREGRDVSIIGFGEFCVVERGARRGRDFKTGGEIEVPARKAVKFKPGKSLKEAANN